MNAKDYFERALVAQTAAAVSCRDDVAHWHVNAAVRLMERRSPIIVTGMGKSGHVGMKAAATFRSLGFPSYFLHPGEASHGDLGMIQDNSVVLAISNSGETKELGDILSYCKDRGTSVIAITSKATSTLADVAVASFITGTLKETCPNGLAPTTSTWVAMLICDCLAVALACTTGKTEDDFHRFHPGGALGARLRPVTAVTKPTPRVHPLDMMKEVSARMTEGAAVVIGKHGVEGIITDGDIRRKLPKSTDPAKNVMTTDPIRIPSYRSVRAAIEIMTDNRVTSLLVEDALGATLGIVYLKDCLTFAN